MGVRTVSDITRNEAGLVDQYIGSAYDIVKAVYDNLDQLTLILTTGSVIVYTSTQEALNATDEGGYYAIAGAQDSDIFATLYRIVNGEPVEINQYPSAAGAWNRDNHTGTQAIATVEGLQEALDEINSNDAADIGYGESNVEEALDDLFATKTSIKTLVELKDIAITQSPVLYDGSVWTFLYGDYTGLNDDLYIVKQDDTALTVGAWNRTSLAEDDKYMQSRDVLRAKAAFASVQQRMFADSPILMPSIDFMKALMTGACKIVVLGDSISYGYDWWYAGGWVSMFEAELQNAIPHIDWTVVNYSLPGRNLADLNNAAYTSPGSFSEPVKTGGDNSNLWPLGSAIDAKSWRDYVKDEAPDLIIMAHGENHTEFNLDAYFETFRAYTATWTKKPWFAVVSCFLPTNQTDPEFGDAFKNANPQRQSIADFWKQLAVKKGYGHIDVNGIFLLLRDGHLREMVPPVIERNFRYFGDATKWLVYSSASFLTTNVIQFTGTDIIRRINNKTRDLDFNADFTKVTSNAAARVSYRLYNDTLNDGYTFQYVWATNTLYLFWNGAEITNWDVTAISGAMTATVNIRVHVIGNRHRCYIRGKLAAEYIDYRSFYSGEVSIGSGVGTMTVTNAQFAFFPQLEAAPEYYTEDILLGNNPSDYLSDPDSIGGDGRHHMSGQGIYLAYLPAVMNWLTDFKRIFERQLVLGTGKKTTVLSFPVDATTNIADTIQITVPKDTTVMINITFGYINLNATDPGQLHLYYDATKIEEWYLEQTLAFGAMKTFTVSHIVEAGTHIISLRVLGSDLDAGVAITSGGDGLARQMTVTFTPA